jgi:tryptophanyl-tRNA synthetase
LGINPAKATIFLQSDVPEVTELSWIFSTITTMPYLMRAHAFKDAEAKNKDINVGLFNYPILMAADILIQEADIVPVGQDQKQHIEIARDMAEKFNHIFGDTFKLPKALIMKEVAVVPGIDGRKMSKSYGNTIPLFASDREIKDAVMSIVTDSKNVNEPKNPEACNVFALHKLVSTDNLTLIKKRYLDGGIGYKESKDILVENIIRFIAPLRERRAEIEKNPDDVRKILRDGGEIARERAHLKMIEVRKKTGLHI